MGGRAAKLVSRTSKLLFPYGIQSVQYTKGGECPVPHLHCRIPFFVVVLHTSSRPKVVSGLARLFA